MTRVTRESRGAKFTDLLSGADVPEETDLRAELYLRSLSPPAGTHGGQRSHLEALSELAQQGDLSDLRVSVWGDSVCLCENCASTRTGRAMIETVEKFERWAARVDDDIELPFDRRRVGEVYSDAPRETLSVPQRLLAVYADSTLIAVFPHTVGGVTYTLADGVEAIRQSVRSRSSATVE